MRNLAKDNTLFSITQEGQTESYISRNNRSDEEILVGQNVNNNDGIVIREEVRIERN
jgi:hypothetical protein